MTLVQFLGHDAGSALSENGTNESGFTSIEGGCHWADNGSFGSETAPSYYWTTPEENATLAHLIFLDPNPEIISQT